MRIRENLRNSIKGMVKNRLRTFLTMLGIIIRVFSVIALTSIGEGVKRQVTSQVESLGANLIYIMPGKVSLKPGRSRLKLGMSATQSGPTISTLTYQDVLAIKPLTHVSSATGMYAGIDRLDKLKIMVSTLGVDEDYPKTAKLTWKYGRFFAKKERIEAARVVVLGYEADKEIFGGAKSIGKSFSLNGKDYRVIGVLAYKKPRSFGPGSEDVNIRIYLPITELISRNSAKNIQQITVKVGAAAQVSSVEKNIRTVLKTRHRTEDFSLLKQQDMLNTINTIIGILTASLGGIAAISLVVGGIGIMNIMLVSVKERTREIGVRKAVGAKYRDILIQFLIEAVVLSLSGGLLGLVAGFFGSKFIPYIIPQVHTAISPLAVGVSLLFAVLVGIFFGVYPAAMAARLDPIEALRSE